MQYYLPTKIIVGRLEEEIKRLVASFSPYKILFVSDQSMKKNGVIDKITELLKDYNVSIFDGVVQKPTLEQVQKAKKDVDLVIGLGGGSVLDVGKVIASDLDKPYIAIPTTAGTGSEVTPFAALYDLENKRKISLDVKFPQVALIDYRLTLTLPVEQVAATGLDALSQAMESYWSIFSNHLSDVHAKRAIELIVENLENSWKGSQKAREMMSLAALEAGLAFSQTKTTAAHSVSYPFSIYYNMPHGFACALTLPYFLLYNYKVSENDCLDNRGPDFVKKKIEEIAAFLGAKDVQTAKDNILELMRSISAPIKMDFDINLVIRDGFSPERVANNPRRLSEAGLEEILKIIKK